MKICIVTVYNSINSGSFWQAKALEMVLKRENYKVVFLKRKGGSASIKYKIKSLIKIFFREHSIKEVKKQINVFKEFKKKQKEFKTISAKKNNYKNIDCFVIGSDTIWNLNSKYFEKNHKIYFGDKFKDNRVVTYAASVGNTNMKKIMQYNAIPTMLNRIACISVRDQATYEIIDKLTDKDIQIVADPTLLIDKEEYRKIVPIPKERRYIFLYLFSDITNEQIDDLKKFAQQKNLKIISGIVNNSKYDKCIDNIPYDFLNYMFYADYIVTDTFHGTIFSINLKKNFVVINRNKKKVNDFLRRFCLEDRLINPPEEISQCLQNEIMYEKVNKELDEFKLKSKEFLIKSINQ